jgi:hypothetical protein
LSLDWQSKEHGYVSIEETGSTAGHGCLLPDAGLCRRCGDRRRNCDAAHYKMVLCAANNGSNSFVTATNTTSPQNPGGIFSFENYCGPAPDPAGNQAFLRIVENQSGGNAGQWAYGSINYDAPPHVHFKAAGGYTRQPGAFNDGWRARFWSPDANVEFMLQGAGAPTPTSNTFGPHLWPWGHQLDFRRFTIEMLCVRPAGCDRSNFNAVDANSFVFILSDDSNSQVILTDGSPMMSGEWVRGTHASISFDAVTLELDHDAFPDGFDSKALERGYEAMKAIVPSIEKVRLQVVPDFTQAVRDAHPDRDYAARYEQERGNFGAAMAKVIPQDGGVIDVIVDARVLASGQDDGVPEQTFKHEAYHVAIRQRGECLDFEHRADWDGGVEAERLRAAEIACEEFRVELPLSRGRPSSHYDSFPDLLAAADGHIHRLSRQYQSSAHEPEDVAAISRGVGEQFGSLVTASGYVAAAMEATGRGLPEVDPRIGRRVLGSSGVAVIERLRDLPPADQGADVGELEAVAKDAASQLDSWISDIGFRWEEVSDNLCFRLLKPLKWL